jgi:dolichol-phosphate mannosyltransferase
MNETTANPIGLYITIVIPVYNEEAVLPEMIKRLGALQAKYALDTFQLLFVDDGSQDKTPHILEASHFSKGFDVLTLSRNFGHQAAVSAGLGYARGDYIAIIDGDLQDPPELIPQMITLMQDSGADVAFGVRKNRKEKPIMRLSYYLFYRLLDRLSPFPIPLDSGDFSVISRRVVHVINTMPERHRFVRGLRSYAGFKQVPFYYSRESRSAGDPKYTFTKLLSLAADGIFTFSEMPLRIATIMGITISTVSFAIGFLLLVWRLSSGIVLPGFATISIGLFFLGGVQLLCLGILGEYIGRIHSEVKMRPSYVVSNYRSLSTQNPSKPR